MSACLYERLMGESWSRLDKSVRDVHLQADALEASGIFEVTHGNNLLARLINALTGMPHPSPTQPLHLTILKKGDGERWVRRFGDHKFASYQEALSGNILAERFGLLEFWFALSAENGVLVYHQYAANLKIGSLRIRLPRWAAPQTVASESPGPTGSAYISIRVSLPLIGHQLSYGGMLSPVPVPQPDIS